VLLTGYVALASSTSSSRRTAEPVPLEIPENLHLDCAPRLAGGHLERQLARRLSDDRRVPVRARSASSRTTGSWTRTALRCATRPSRPARRHTAGPELGGGPEPRLYRFRHTVVDARRGQFHPVAKHAHRALEHLVDLLVEKPVTSEMRTPNDCVKAAGFRYDAVQSPLSIIVPSPSPSPSPSQSPNPSLCDVRPCRAFSFVGDVSRGG
jgi:hypothetical protein